MLSDPSKFVFIELPLSCMVSQDGSTVTWVLRNWRQMEKGHNDLHELPLCKMLSICKSPYKVQTTTRSHKNHILYVQWFSSHQDREMGTRFTFFVLNNNKQTDKL